MVLIHTRQADDTTIKVIKWLQSKHKEIFRINFIEDLAHAAALVENGRVTSVYLNGSGMVYNRIETSDSQLTSQVQQYLNGDIAAIWVSLLTNKFSHLHFFGNPSYPGNILNKINVLEDAAQLGFTIPSYELISQKDRLIDFMNMHGRIICKSLVDGFNAFTGNSIISGQRTEEILRSALDQFDNHFFPTFVQQLVEKIFEARVFYYNELIYALATFSQSNENSKIDGRTSDSSSPQRRVPFILPDAILNKVKKLMKKLKLNYGSLDFIVTEQYDFYFLEVNPYGQYGFLSTAGNFYIEEKIAESL